MKKIINLAMFLLLFGIVDQINGDVATIEYEKDGKTMYSQVSVSLSSCVPKEGMRVHFFEGYKVVSCHTNG